MPDQPRLRHNITGSKAVDYNYLDEKDEYPVEEEEMKL